MSALLVPDVAETILDAYWRRNGESPKLFTIDLARFLMIIKMVVSIAAIVVHFVALAEIYVIVHGARAEGQGLVLLILSIPVLIAIWSRRGSLRRRVLAWLAGFATSVAGMIAAAFRRKVSAPTRRFAYDSPGLATSTVSGARHDRNDPRKLRSSLPPGPMHSHTKVKPFWT